MTKNTENVKEEVCWKIRCD